MTNEIEVLPTWSVYRLLHPETLTPFYVGHTDNETERKAHHIIPSSVTRAAIGGLTPIFEAVVRGYTTKYEAMLDESRLIKELRAQGFPLINIHSEVGGLGSPWVVEGMSKATWYRHRQKGQVRKGRGRPLAKDADKSFAKTKPWIAGGISQATWYRRRRI